MNRTLGLALGLATLAATTAAFAAAHDVVATNPHNGAKIAVTKGAKVSLRLTSNPTTGYDWQVTAVDRSLGYPTKSFIHGVNLVGAGGTTVLTWKTAGAFPTKGDHRVQLQYKRSWEHTALKTLNLTISIK